MRIMLEDETVLARPLFALIAVTQNVFGLRGLLGHERPLHPGIESSSATPAQAGVFYQIHNRIRLHAERFLDGLVAVELQVAIDISRTLAKAFGYDFYFVGMGNQVSHFVIG